MRDNLEENPLGRYKYISAQFAMNYDMVVTSRQTYSLLDWLGDVGGLTDALFYLA